MRRWTLLRCDAAACDCERDVLVSFCHRWQDLCIAMCDKEKSLLQLYGRQACLRRRQRLCESSATTAPSSPCTATLSTDRSALCRRLQLLRLAWQILFMQSCRSAKHLAGETHVQCHRSGADHVDQIRKRCSVKGCPVSPATGPCAGAGSAERCWRQQHHAQPLHAVIRGEGFS